MEAKFGSGAVGPPLPLPARRLLPTPGGLLGMPGGQPPWRAIALPRAQFCKLWGSFWAQNSGRLGDREKTARQNGRARRHACCCLGRHPGRRTCGWLQSRDAGSKGEQAEGDGALGRRTAALTRQAAGLPTAPRKAQRRTLRRVSSGQSPAISRAVSLSPPPPAGQGEGEGAAGPTAGVL